MSKEYSFSVMPSVNISRSRFARKSQHKTSFNLGQIIPIYVDECLPGDTRSIDMASLVRMSTPIAPIMDNIYMDYFAFFVPNRLVWTHWKEFMGENNTGAGIPQVEYSIPYIGLDSDDNKFQTGSYGDYMGLPVNKSFGYYDESSDEFVTTVKVSALPFRGLALIYNEWFRNQNIIPPLAIDMSDNNEVLVNDSSNDFVRYSNKVLKAAKMSDYFTKSLPYAQKSEPVSIPLGTSAPIISDGNYHALGQNAKFWTNSSTLAGGISTTGSGVLAAGGTSVSGNAVSGTSLVADLSVATSATINQLRYAFQLQKLLEKDALYGTRYWEILASHFGVSAPDASLQRPEYLGGFRQRVNIDQVLSTTGYDDTSATDLGKPGANSVTGSRNSLFTKSFVEHGYLFILAVARHDQTYSQGINRMWTRSNRYDFYFPVFANLGAQEVKNKEIYVQGSADDDNVFGYQESWAEYRYKPSIATGLLNPNAANSLNYWTLTNKFDSKPTLGRTFIEQGRDNIKRALATGDTGPDFICDFYFEDIAVRPMPMYSIPGLIDHH